MNDTQPKKANAKQPAAPKSEYFFPELGVTVLATSMVDAVSQANKLKPQEKVGDE
jgi:hypothetical protein